MWTSIALGVSTLLHVAHAAVSTTGFTVSLNDIPYFVPPTVVTTIKVPDSLASAFSLGSFVPITVLSAAVSVSDITASVSSLPSKDDVWQDGFLEAIWVQSANDTSLPYQINSGNTSSILVTATAAKSIPPGPYFLSSAGAVHQAYRLYSDVQGAFTESVLADSEGLFSVLPAGTMGQKLAVAVPSRLYYTATTDKPLAGVRVGIKDIYDIKGLRTSNGNRAWFWFYPPANATAPPAQNLIDAGAIVVGKMLTSQFANGETATADWVDYHEAFNPRGDGYQDTSSSSSGPGAGEGSYDWLDVTLGSDTGGSVRGPSQEQGLFGNRPSHGLVELTNTMPLAPELDTAGLLTRDPALWAKAAKAIYKENITFTSNYPSKVYTVQFPASRSSIANTIILDFLGNLTSFLSANTTAFNFTSAWATDNPTSDPINTILNTTYPFLIAKEQTRLVRDPFYADYAAAHDGRRPFVDPVPLVRWSYADNSSATIEEAVANKTLFQDWFAEKVLVPDNATCSDAVMLYVGSTGGTVYRNQYFSAPGVPFGFSSGRISVFSEAPDFVIPIGEAPYNSTITKHVEYLPVTVDILAAKGCDGMLFSLINDLLKAGIVQVSKTGQSSVTGGEILLKRSVEVQ